MVKGCINHMTSVAPITRFAPSPTGRLHLGHAFSALKAHDFARDGGGAFLLRIEDIDGTRSREEHVSAIIDDLTWLGLAWDGAVVRQSQRLDLYAQALDRLRAPGLLYPCFCTRADIVASLSAPHGPSGAIYPGTCRGLPAPDLSKPHCWRLDTEKAIATLPVHGKDLWWHDSHAGRIPATPFSHGDIILARKDAPASYHLAVTVDDAAQGVTDIVRGIDLFESTHVHRLLQALLDLPTPRYHHHALLTAPDGTRLAKRNGAPTLADLRASGMGGRELAEMLRRGHLPAGFASS